MFGVAGTGYNVVRRLAEDGKVKQPTTSPNPLFILQSTYTDFHSPANQPIRHSLDDWERMMMKRDERLTGSLRGQSVSFLSPLPSPPTPEIGFEKAHAENVLVFLMMIRRIHKH